MEIQALWEDGVFKPVKPLHLKGRLVTLQVSDAEIEDIVPGKEQEVLPGANKPTPEVRDRASAFLKKLEQIHRQILALPEDQLPALPDKQLERMQAMEMREDR